MLTLLPVTSHDSIASRLCAACGMCCNGVLFHTVRLQPGESPKELLSLGLKLKYKDRAQSLIQPCQAHRDSHCTIYEHRPQRCRLFECRQLRRVASGEITEEAALEKIHDTIGKVDSVNALFERMGNTNGKRPFTKRYKLIMATPVELSADPEILELRNQLTTAVNELDDVLNRDFRPEGTATTSAEDSDAAK
ncbi:MAG: YkgJ family cysteine cluster protein [Chthoniobacterales bacterium]